jgi:predicted DNA-binding protein YlxM (UPF0122 family)
LNELALFAGAGGGVLGGLLLGWRTVCAVEINDYCRRVLAQRQIDGILEPFPIWDDVTTFSKEVLDDLLSLQQEELHMAGKLKKLTEEQVGQAVLDYDSGQSLAAIAHVYGITRQAAWDLLRRRTTMRDQKRFSHDNHFFRNGSRADQRAHDITEKAIKSGKLAHPGKCEKCGSTGEFRDGRTAVQAHHDDYNEPLRVRWLCQPCHHEWHRNNQPIAARGGPEPTEIDVISGGFP